MKRSGVTVLYFPKCLLNGGLPKCCMSSFSLDLRLTLHVKSGSSEPSRLFFELRLWRVDGHAPGSAALAGYRLRELLASEPPGVESPPALSRLWSPCALVADSMALAPPAQT